MNRKFIVIIILSFIFIPVAEAQEPFREASIAGKTNQSILESAPLTLSDCYKLALKQSEVIAINKDLIKEAESHFLQSLGLLLPNISFSYVKSNQDTGSLTGNVFKNAAEQKFVFKQNLFSGFKEFAGISGSHLERDQRINEKERAEQLLFADVADAFYLLLEQKEDLETLQEIRGALVGRIQELKDREKIGRSRRSEVVNTEAQLYSIDAEIESVESQEAVARQLLEFLTGHRIDKIADTDNDSISLNPEIYYISKVNQRPDVQALEKAWGVTKKRVSIARSDFFPTLSLEADYYTRRQTAPLDTKWSSFLTLNVPIFEGTTTFGAVREANLIAHQAQLQYSLAKRSALEDIRDSYVKMTAVISRCDALKKALDAYELNYNLQKDDYKLNLVSNLDVLQAIQTLGSSKRSYIQAFYEKKRFYWQLLASIGEITEKE